MLKNWKRHLRYVSALDIVNTSGGATGASLILRHDSASPAVDDTVGNIYFKGDDDAGNVTEYARIYSNIRVVDDGIEDAGFYIFAMKAGTSAQMLELTYNGSQLDCGEGGLEILTTGASGVSSEGLQVTVTNDTEYGALIQTEHVSASPAAADVLRWDYIRGRDAGANDTDYIEVMYRITNPAEGSEEGDILWQLFTGGAANEAMKLSGAGALNLDSVLQAGAALAATVAYNRFGATATGHSLASDDDLMVSGKLEVDGYVYLDSRLYVADILASDGGDDLDIRGDMDGTADKGTVIKAYNGTAWVATLEINNRASGTPTIGFWGVTPVVQPSTVADATGCTGDADDKVNLVIDLLQSLGLMA